MSQFNSNFSDGVVTTVAGAGKGDVDGRCDVACFKDPWSVAFDHSGETLFIADNGNNKIKKIHQGTVQL